MHLWRIFSLDALGSKKKNISQNDKDYNAFNKDAFGSINVMRKSWLGVQYKAKLYRKQFSGEMGKKMVLHGENSLF